MYKEVSLFEFQKKFSDEASCERYLFEQRWPDGFECPRCKHKGHSFIKGRGLYECNKCGAQVSLIAGTIFHKTRVPLQKWFWMMFEMSRNKHGYSVLGLQKLLGIGHYDTAWKMAHKIRKAMADRDGQYKLSGIVEMDDSYFGGKRKKGKTGRGASGKVPVVVAVEQRNENARFAAIKVVSDVSGESIKEAAKEKVEKGTAIKTDGWPSYNVIQSEGYRHQPENVSVSKEAMKKQLNWAHIVISNAKRFILGTHHGVSPKHLHRYLSEYCYRFNRRYWEGQLFERLMKSCVITRTITYPELSG